MKRQTTCKGRSFPRVTLVKVFGGSLDNDKGFFVLTTIFLQEFLLRCVDESLRQSKREEAVMTT